MSDAVVVVTEGDSDEGEAAADIIEEAAEAAAEIIEEATDAAVEIVEAAAEVEAGSSGGTTDAEVDRILEVERRLNALESRPWPVSPEYVEAVAEEAASEALAVALAVDEAIVDETPSDDEITIVEPDVKPEGRNSGIKNLFRKYW